MQLQLHKTVSFTHHNIFENSTHAYPSFSGKSLLWGSSPNIYSCVQSERCDTMLKAGVPLNNINLFTDLFEEHECALTNYNSSHAIDTLKFVRSRPSVYHQFLVHIVRILVTATVACSIPMRCRYCHLENSQNTLTFLCNT